MVDEALLAMLAAGTAVVAGEDALDAHAVVDAGMVSCAGPRSYNAKHILM